jgi:hypothetical protein
MKKPKIGGESKRKDPGYWAKLVNWMDNRYLPDLRSMDKPTRQSGNTEEQLKLYYPPLTSNHNRNHQLTIRLSLERYSKSAFSPSKDYPRDCKLLTNSH